MMKTAALDFLCALGNWYVGLMIGASAWLAYEFAEEFYQQHKFNRERQRHLHNPRSQ